MKFHVSFAIELSKRFLLFPSPNIHCFNLLFITILISFVGDFYHNLERVFVWTLMERTVITYDDRGLYLPD